MTEERAREFLQKGVKTRYFFPHRTYYLPKCGMDALKQSERVCGNRDPNKMFLISLNASGHVLKGLSSGELFFDRDLVWHQQQFGKEGHIAYADVAIAESRMYGLSYVSDIVQRISRRREYKTQVENRFRGWPVMIINSIVNLALEMGVRTIFSPSADLIMAHTDRARQVQRELFDRVYDRGWRKQFIAKKQDGWWVMDVAENKARVVQGKQETELVEDEKTICVCHDIERGLGHLQADPTFATEADKHAPQALEGMLDVEATMNVKSTYNVVGTLLGAVRDQIEAGRHCIAFHSFDHNLEEWQLDRCRQVDHRIKGYRTPQSRITPELNDMNLCQNNFDWLASSISSLGLNTPLMQNRIVKIPIVTDDFDLYKRRIDYPDWEDRLLQGIAQRKFTAFGLHDCYGEFWLPHYKELLAKIKDLGTLQTLNNVSDQIICQTAF